MKHDVDQFRYEARKEIHEACRDSLSFYHQRMFPLLAPATPFIPARHGQVIATALEKVARGEIRRLLVAIPPRHGKSLLSSVSLSTWMLGRDPSAKIICASYGDALAKDFAHQSRDLMLSESYRQIFPNSVLESTALDELRTTAKGYRLATSVGGVITGKGADIVILDDPMKAADAHSESARNTAYDWIKHGVMSRFDDPAKGALIVIMQRLHQDDVMGRLRDEGDFEVLEMPGEAITPQKFDLGGGKTWDFQPGDLLYPEVYTREALDQLRFDLGEIGYSAQILQQPTPLGGALFKLKHIQRYDVLPKSFEKIVQSCDPAVVDAANNSYCVCTTWGIWRKKLYLIDVFRKRLNFHQVPPAILSLRDKFQANVVILEVAGIGKAVGDVLAQGDYHWRGWLAPYEPKQDKLSRAIPTTILFERKLIHLPKQAEWLETYEAELGQFPRSKYDDQVDSTTQFLFALTRHNIVTRDLSAYPVTPV
jgi:predicted phage terminase large subunit-like protein